MKKKYSYFVVLQQNLKWQDIESYETNSDYQLNTEQKKELKELRIKNNSNSYPLRTIHRRKLIES